MYRWACLLFLAGCDLVFDLEDVEPPSALCLGDNGPGETGLFAHCLQTQPPDDLDGIIDIDTNDDASCTTILAQGDADRTEVCVVAARNIEISAIVLTHGKRPLVLAAIETFSITGTGAVMAASRRGEPNGAGANFARCPGALAGVSAGTTSGGAGGAGGSFQGLGGQGGVGNGNINHAQPEPELAPAFLRGGCQGGNGGDAAIALGGSRGSGGGGLYLMAGDELSVAGVISVAGEAGEGGSAGSAGTSGGAGGGGGGSGGLIGLDAPRITLAATARLISNGGGGGGGASSSQTGKRGGESNADAAFPFLALGGDGGSMNAGGKGGDGATIESAAAEGANYTLTAGGAAGGGGGGSTGFIRLFANHIDDRGAAISPAAN